MKVVLSITAHTDGSVERAGYQLYDVDGSLLASETSSGMNVVRRSPVEMLTKLLDEATGLAQDCDPREF